MGYLELVFVRVLFPSVVIEVFVELFFGFVVFE